MTHVVTSAVAPGIDDVSSWDLVAAGQGGDRSAFGELYKRYVDQVFRYHLRRAGGDWQLAEDLTSETFLRMLRRIDSFSYQGRDVGALLTTIARNLVVDYWKSSRTQRQVLTNDVEELVAHIVTDLAGCSVEDKVTSRQAVAEVMRCVAQLRSDDQRQCIQLRFLEGRSVAETAVAMGRNEGAVKALQHRAVRELARLLHWPLSLTPSRKAKYCYDYLSD